MAVADVFSVPIFLIILRESIEAGIIVSILLSFVKQLVYGRPGTNLPSPAGVPETTEAGATATSAPTAPALASDAVPAVITTGRHNLTDQQLYKKLVWQVWLGFIIGLGVALAIGAVFIAIFYTKLKDLWAQTEEMWEGAFSLLASGLILVMGIAFLKLEGSSAKWRVHLAHAFEEKHADDAEDKAGKGGKYALLVLPCITVLREGLEAIVFVGGVSLSESATAIPLAVVVGLICGGIVSYLIYRGGAVMAIRYFLIVSTCILFLVGAGLFSRAIGFFQAYVFNRAVGADVAEIGDGPGSFNVQGNVWHLTYGNWENPQTGGGWSIFNAILGWTNTATLGTVLSYVGYWLAVIFILTYLKWKEGRSKIFGLKSAAYIKRHEREAARRQAEEDAASDEKGSVSAESLA